MGQFKPMVKMMTTEPTVELKLKRGGSATHERHHAEGGRVPSGMMGSKAIKHGGKAVKKADGGALSMAAPVMGNPAAARAMAARRMARTAPPMGPTAQTGRPPMPMPAPMATPGGAMARPPMMKEGGKVDLAQDKAMIKKAFKQHDMQEHKGAKGTKLKLKDGGAAMDSAMTKTTVKGNAGKFAKTMVVDGDKADRARGTGVVKEGNAGGYKKGGRAMCWGGKMATGGAIPSETIRGKPSKTIMDEAKPDRARGTGGVKMGNAAGFKKGGRPFAVGGGVEGNVVGTPPGITGARTGAVRESNAGGYKRGGSPVKKYARGGGVQDDGAAVKMPQGRKPPSSPVAISELSGTFKRGGKVC
jgi:hypothetical protein